VIFTEGINKFFPSNAAHDSAYGKVTIHEVGHQLGLAWFSEGGGKKEKHRAGDNIMTEQPVPVPMDFFYFAVDDLIHLRGRVESPGVDPAGKRR
jgi:hypothetical protein